MLSLLHTAVVLKCSVLLFNDVDFHSPASLPKLTLILDPDVLVSLLNLFCSSSVFFFFLQVHWDFLTFFFFSYSLLSGSVNKGCSNSRVKQAGKTNYIFYFMCSSCHLPIFLPVQFFFLLFFFTAKNKVFSCLWNKRIHFS